MRRSLGLCLAAFVTGLGALLPPNAGAAAPSVSASSAAAGFPAEGAVDGNRFATEGGHAWKGTPGRTNWEWQISFPAARRIGAILQINGDHRFVFTNAPAVYVWQASLDGQTWHELSDTAVAKERRLYRTHRLRSPERCRHLRLHIRTAEGAYPTLREVEFYESSRAQIEFPSWILAVNTTHEASLPGHGWEFIPLARSCPGWERLEAQQVWLGDFDAAVVNAEPRPLCAFLSGNFKDWCEIDRAWWRGTESVLNEGWLPMWASCGGAQGLALLSEYGTDKAWDCPHCRDPEHPKSPIYTHIGHTAKRPCGDYSGCIFERGLVAVKPIGSDPVFASLPGEFPVVESHCGQLERPPRGWELVAVGGAGSKTRVQCIRLSRHCVYGAQFHLEMAGAPETAGRITANFLALARQWSRRR